MNHYDDIINHPYNGKQKGERMSMHQRAAQFAPFAALVGHNAMIAETARLTDCEEYIGEEEYEALNRKFKYLISVLDQKPQITVTYFIHDERKEGGRYMTSTGCISKVDEYRNSITMDDGTVIPLSAVLEINTQEL